jgi:hypothetical protein
VSSPRDGWHRPGPPRCAPRSSLAGEADRSSDDDEHLIDFEDKIVQRATAAVLGAVHEEDFLEFS